MSEHDPLDERLIDALRADEPVDVSGASAEVVRRGRRRRVRKRAVLGIAAAAVVIAVGGAAIAARSSGRGTVRVEGPREITSTSSPSTSTTVPTDVAVDTAVNPKVAVTPDRELVDGARVTVKVTGFGVGGKVRLSECASEANASTLGCGKQLPEQMLLVTNEHRAGSAPFVVRSRAPVKGYDAAHVEPCLPTCVIVATGGGGFAYAPIAFDAPPRGSSPSTKRVVYP